MVAVKVFCEQFLRPFLENNCREGIYEVAHYWSKKGTNKYEDFDQVILLGAANPNVKAIHAQEQACRLDEEYISDEIEENFKQYGDTDLEGRTWLNIFGGKSKKNADFVRFVTICEFRLIYIIRPVFAIFMTLFYHFSRLFGITIIAVALLKKVIENIINNQSN